jgi:hypothetical protein
MGNIIIAKWLNNARRGRHRLKVIRKIPKQIPQGIPSWRYIRRRRHMMELAELLWVITFLALLALSISGI